MNRDERFLDGIEALGLHVEPSLDTTAAAEYVVLSYTSEGTLYGDDSPCLEMRNWQMVYVAPVGYDRTDIRNKLRWLVYDTYEVWPSEDDVSDANGQRFLYDFSTFGGFDDGKI